MELNSAAVRMSNLAQILNVDPAKSTGHRNDSEDSQKRGSAAILSDVWRAFEKTSIKSKPELVNPELQTPSKPVQLIPVASTPTNLKPVIK